MASHTDRNDADSRPVARAEAGPEASLVTADGTRHLARTVTRTPGLRPPLKWAGGKRWLVPHLKKLWAPHDHRRLVEPLCGGLAVTWA
jgi:hypothetical protein